MCELYEILVPTIRNDGRPISVRFHRVWDSKVRAISKGLTIFQPSKGQWVSETGDLYTERMIPVRIACTEEQIHKIAEMTTKYYEQLSVMYYRVSDKVFFTKAKEQPCASPKIKKSTRNTQLTTLRCSTLPMVHPT